MASAQLLPNGKMKVAQSELCGMLEADIRVEEDSSGVLEQWSDKTSKHKKRK